MKEEPTNSFIVGTIDVGAVTVLRTFGRTNRRKMTVINWIDWHPTREPLRTSSLKGGAAGAVGE
jgi:hypothetical protein